ncbi:MAG: aminotransferase class III-fold pyridoxal phosphate-dependent enzyme [Acidimicrobiales bacterium]
MGDWWTNTGHREVIMSRSPFLHPFARPAAAAEEFITITRGEGALVWDENENEYIDAIASLWYCNVGHGRWEIVDQVASQMAVLENYNTFDIFTNEKVETFAAFVAAAAPMADSRIFFTSSGSEAVETALKLARLTHSLRGNPERTEFVGRVNSYHGVAYGGVSVQGLPLNQQHFGPLLDTVHQVAAHDIAEVEELFERHGAHIAAFITEPVQGAGGVHPPVDGYLARVRELCDQYGVLMIFDEVITGFGRLGSWFAASYYGVVPDMITFAKGCTSGYLPLGGVVVGEIVLDAIEADPNFMLRHGYTYSGHPSACAAALANAAILIEEHLFDRVPVIAERIGGGLSALVASGVIVEARGVGGIWSAELPAGLSAPIVRNEMMKHGVIARPVGASVIAFCPPFVTTDAQLDRCVVALGKSIEALT